MFIRPDYYTRRVNCTTSANYEKGDEDQANLDAYY